MTPSGPTQCRPMIGVVEEIGELAFATAQVGFRPSPLGNIAEDQYASGDASLLIADGRGAVVDRSFRAIFRNQDSMVRQPDNGAFPQHPLSRIFNALAY